MQFLKILFWCLLAFVAALFTYANWNSVPIRLWGGLIADTNLPLLLLVTFLIGFAPTHLYHLTRRWRLRQRLATTERTLADVRALAATPALPTASEGATPADPAGTDPVDAEPARTPQGQLL